MIDQNPSNPNIFPDKNAEFFRKQGTLSAAIPTESNFPADHYLMHAEFVQNAEGLGFCFIQTAKKDPASGADQIVITIADKDSSRPVVSEEEFILLQAEAACLSLQSILDDRTPLRMIARERSEPFSLNYIVGQNEYKVDCTPRQVASCDQMRVLRRGKQTAVTSSVLIERVKVTLSALDIYWAELAVPLLEAEQNDLLLKRREHILKDPWTYPTVERRTLSRMHPGHREPLQVYECVEELPDGGDGPDIAVRWFLHRDAAKAAHISVKRFKEIAQSLCPNCDLSAPRPLPTKELPIADEAITQHAAGTELLESLEFLKITSDVDAYQAAISGSGKRNFALHDGLGLLSVMRGLFQPGVPDISKNYLRRIQEEIRAIPGRNYDGLGFRSLSKEEEVIALAKLGAILDLLNVVVNSREDQSIAILYAPIRTFHTDVIETAESEVERDAQKSMRMLRDKVGGVLSKSEKLRNILELPKKRAREYTEEEILSAARGLLVNGPIINEPLPLHPDEIKRLLISKETYTALRGTKLVFQALGGVACRQRRAGIDIPAVNSGSKSDSTFAPRKKENKSSNRRRR